MGTADRSGRSGGNKLLTRKSQGENKGRGGKCWGGGVGEGEAKEGGKSDSPFCKALLQIWYQHIGTETQKTRGGVAGYRQKGQEQIPPYRIGVTTQSLARNRTSEKQKKKKETRGA